MAGAALPERDDPVELVGDGGLVAEVGPGNWPVVGGDAAVRMNKPGAAEWPGALVAFRRAKRLELEWTLKSGEKRSQVVYDTDVDRYDVGSHLPVSSPRYTWDATVTSATPAACATIRYRIQSGAEREKQFFADCQLIGYFEPQSDGSAIAHVFG